MRSVAINPKPIDPKTAFVAGLICWLIPVALFVAMGKNLPAMVLAPVPLVLAMLVSPGFAFYTFMLTVPVYMPFHLTGGAIWAFDLAMALLVAGLVIQFLVRGETEVKRTPVDIPFLLLIVATWLSAFFAYRIQETLIPSIRILVIFLAFRAIFVMCTRIGVRKICLFYIHLVGSLSVINILLFVYHRGTERVFGPAWLAFENYAMTALPMALAFLIWSRTRSERVRFTTIIILIALAVMASGSRGTLVAIALAVPILIWLAHRKIRRDQMGEARHSINRVLLAAVIIGVTVVLFSSSLLVGFVGRMEELVASIANPRGSIALRLVLWTAAFKAWLTSPIVGIGIGNFNLVDEVVPEMKTAPVWYYIRGMSAHNVVFHYLAETGILGVAALLAVTASGLRMARSVFRRELSAEETQTSGAIMIAMVVFALSIFFMRAWTWAQEGYIMAMLFGMTAALWHQYESQGTE
jgi:O-antigen ligase